MPNLEYIASVRDRFSTALGSEPKIVAPHARPDSCPPFDFGIYRLDDVGAYKLVTLGLSAEPLNHPETDRLRVELAVTVPDTLMSENGVPPVWLFNELGSWAQMPFLENTFLWKSHTLAAGPLEPLGPDNDFVAWIVTDPFFVSDEAVELEIDGESVFMLDLLPIYSSELALAREHGSSQLLDRMAEARIPPLVAPGRKNVAL